MMFLQLLGLLITYFLLTVQMTSPPQSASAQCVTTNFTDDVTMTTASEAATP